MNSNNSNNHNKKELICPICKDILKEYDYIYDSLKDVKINYKCDTCGHKSTKII